MLHAILKHDKIFWAVIGANLIDVMHDGIVWKIATDGALNNKYMFTNITTADGSWMPFRNYQYIAVMNSRHLVED